MLIKEDRGDVLFSCSINNRRSRTLVARWSTSVIKMSEVTYSNYGPFITIAVDLQLSLTYIPPGLRW